MEAKERNVISVDRNNARSQAWLSEIGRRRESTREWKGSERKEYDFQSTGTIQEVKLG